MGRGMVLNLLKGGHSVRVIAHNNREPIDEVVAKGAVEASSLATLVEGVEVVILCLSDLPSVERIAAAIKPHMRHGQTIIDTRQLTRHRRAGWRASFPASEFHSSMRR